MFDNLDTFKAFHPAYADLSPEMVDLPGYHSAFHYADKKGYSGVGLYARAAPDAIVAV